jgi:serine/threonine protein kinase
MRDITDQERKTIETELKLLKDFRHPNIVAFRDSFIDKNGSLNIVMPYCEGGDLHNLI